MHESDELVNKTDERRPSIIDRWPSWSWLLVLGGIIAFFWILSLLSPNLVYDQFIDRFYLEPIREDGGYNPVNTISWIVLLLLLVLWLYKLTKELDETVDISLILAVTPYLVLGSVYRVLEDADLFAPFRGVGGVTGFTSCAPDLEGGLLETCLGTFFITPIIYVEVLFVGVFYLIAGHEAKRVAHRFGLSRGLLYYAALLAMMVVLYTALWASEPVWIRYLHHPVWIVLAALAAFAFVWRHATSTRRIEPHMVVFSGGLLILLPGLLYVSDWMLGESWGRAATPDTHPWVLLALILAPAMLALVAFALGRTMSRPKADEAATIVEDAGDREDEDEAEAKPPSGVVPFWTFLAILLAVSVALFVSLVGAKRIEDGAELAPNLLLMAVGPVAAAAGFFFARSEFALRLPHHASMIYFTAPLALLMIIGQMADAIMTAVGIDLYGSSEKHVAPTFLISAVQNSGIPILSEWPTATAMLTVKLVVVLAVIWLIDVGSRETRQNLSGLIKLSIIMVGLSPAIRNTVRLAMNT